MNICRSQLSDEGFTLLEMLLALAVIAFVASASTIALSGRISALRTTEAIGSVSNTVREARLRALGAGTDVSLVFDLPSGTMTRLPDGSLTPIPSTIEVSVQVDRLQATVDKATIVFFADGSSSGGRILLSIDKRSYLIDVDWLTGLIRQERLADEE